MWEKIDDPVGLKPTFVIICHMCYLSDLLTEGIQKFERMVLRYTSLTKLPNISPRAHACNMHYKCPRCGHVEVFGVVISKEYYEELLKRRGGNQGYEPKEYWHEKRVADQLTALGYFGGG